MTVNSTTVFCVFHSKQRKRWNSGICRAFLFVCFIQTIWWKGEQTHRRCRACRAGGVQAVGAGWPGYPGHSLPLLPSFKQLLCVLFLSFLSAQVSLISVVVAILFLLLTKLVRYWPKRTVDEFRLPNVWSLQCLPFFWSPFQWLFVFETTCWIYSFLVTLITFVQLQLIFWLAFYFLSKILLRCRYYLISLTWAFQLTELLLFFQMVFFISSQILRIGLLSKVIKDVLSPIFL